MTAKFSWEIHRHGQERAPRLENVGPYQLSDNVDVTGGYMLAFKCPVRDLSRVVLPGDHLVLRDRAGVCEAWGIVMSVDGGYARDAASVLATYPTQVSLLNPLAYLGLVGLSAPVGETDTVGTLFSVLDWAKINADIATDYQSGLLGIALQKLFSKVANIQLPETLGGGTLGQNIPIVYDDATAGWFAPARVGQMEPVSVVAGAAPAKLSFNYYENTVLKMLHSAFVPDSKLIELFWSLEDMSTDEARTTNVDPARAGLFDQAELATRPNALATALGRRPVIIYRLKPYRARPLLEVVTARRDDYREIDKVHALVLSGQSVPKQELADAAVRTVSTARARAEEMRLLETAYNQVTWDTTRSIEIPMSAVRSHRMKYDNERRINATTINLSTDDTGGIEAMSSFGLPLRNVESIKNHGLFIARPTWPYSLLNSDTTPWVAYMRSIAATLMQFEQAAHVMASGPLVINPDRLSAPITAGTMVRLKIDNTDDYFYGYVREVQRQFTVSKNGVESQNTTLLLERGLFGIEQLRDAQVLVHALQAGSRGAVQGGVSSLVTSYPASPPAAPADRAPGGPREFGAWLYTSAYNSPGKVADTAARVGLSHLDVFVNGYTRPEFHSAETSKIEAALELWLSRGFYVSLTSWFRPNAEWVDGVGRVSDICRKYHVGLTLDLEDPLTRPAANMSPAQRSYWASQLFDAIGADVTVCGTGIVLGPAEVLRPFYSRCHLLAPQSYANVFNTHGLRMNPTDPPHGTLEELAVNKYATFGKPLVLGLAAWDLEGAYYRSDEAALAVSCYSARALNKGGRFWNYHTLVANSRYVEIARRYL